MKMISISHEPEVPIRGDKRAIESAISAVVCDKSNVALINCLDRLLSSEYLLAEAAQKSYRHQLGFSKFVLMADDDGRCLRLHLWDSQSFVKEDVHSHCADFRSRVVLGSLLENSFDLVPGEGYERFRYRFDSVAGHSMAVKDGITGIRLRESRALDRGHIYVKKAADLHNVSDAAHGTVTVSDWSLRRSEALVLKERGAQPEDCSATAGLPPDSVRSSLRIIRERLDAR